MEELLHPSPPPVGISAQQAYLQSRVVETDFPWCMNRDDYPFT
jgi:hypothetical protein